VDSRKRFVLIYAVALMVPFIIFTFLSVNDIGIFVSSYAILYFALKLILNPKIRLRVDVLGIVLLASFAYFAASSALLILKG
jgi:hypothetical protein